MPGRVIHIILALLVFVSSSGFIVNKHYCQKQLKSVAIFQHARNCHQGPQAAMPASCPMHQAATACGDKDSDKKDGCCNEETDYVKMDIDQQITTFDYPAFNLPALVAILHFFFLDTPCLPAQNIDYLHYKPPLLVYDRPVSLQTFLL